LEVQDTMNLHASDQIVRAPRFGVDNKRVRHQLGWALLTVVVIVGVLVIAAPGIFTQYDPTATGDQVLQGPSAAHWFGTDQLGRDVFTRVVYGARPVWVASVLGVGLATLGGVTLGVVGGAPRLVGTVVMRAVDVLLALPVLLIALLVMAMVGTGLTSIMIAVGVAYTPGFARVVNSSVRKLRSAEYVQAAKVFGSTGLRTALRHLLPNLATEVVVLISSAIGWATLTATTLSFLGLGVRLPAPDWGSDLAAGATYLSTAWWLSAFPGAAITVIILLSNYLGDRVVTVLDPRSGVRPKQTLRRVFLGDKAAVLGRRAVTAPGGRPRRQRREGKS
jgi:peptide/nickel transport system permease protein